MARDPSFAVYTAARVVHAVVSFFTVRFVIAYLSKEQYGLWGYLGAISAMMVPLVSLSLPQAMMRFYFDLGADDTDGQDALTTTTFVVNAAGAVLFAAGVCAVWLLAGLDASAGAFFATITPAAILVVFINSLARVRNDYWLFFASHVLSACGFALLMYWASVALDAGSTSLGVAGDPLRFVIGAYAAIAWSVVAICVAYYIWRGAITTRVALLPRSEIAALVRYALPLSGTYFLGWVLNSSDLYLLKRLSSLGQVADYVFAVGAAAVVALVTQGALLDWGRFYFAEMRDNRPNRDAIISSRVRLFLILHAAMIVVVRLAAPLVYELLGADEYTDGLTYISYLLLGNYFFLAGNLFGAGIGYAKKTHLTLVAFAIPGALNIGLNLWLIPAGGASAAAITTLVAFVAFAIALWVLARRYYRFGDHAGIALATAAAVAAAFVPIPGYF